MPPRLPSSSPEQGELAKGFLIGALVVTAYSVVYVVTYPVAEPIRRLMGLKRQKDLDAQYAKLENEEARLDLLRNHSSVLPGHSPLKWAISKIPTLETEADRMEIIMKAFSSSHSFLHKESSLNRQLRAVVTQTIATPALRDDVLTLLDLRLKDRKRKATRAEQNQELELCHRLQSKYNPLRSLKPQPDAAE